LFLDAFFPAGRYFLRLLDPIIFFCFGRNGASCAFRSFPPPFSSITPCPFIGRALVPTSPLDRLSCSPQVLTGGVKMGHRPWVHRRTGSPLLQLQTPVLPISLPFPPSVLVTKRTVSFSPFFLCSLCFSPQLSPLLPRRLPSRGEQQVDLTPL